MDELELLKKQWQRQEESLPRLSYDDIYKMILKKSSSIVKWLFLISIGEMLFWIALVLLIPKSNYDAIEEIELGNVVFYSNLIYYIIFLGFIYLFYRNHKRISATSNAKELMENILRTRSTVKYLIVFNITWMGIAWFATNVFFYFNSDIILGLMQQDPKAVAFSSNELLFYFFLVQAVVGILLIGGLLVFYRVIYGIFLRRLHKNYKELEKMEA